MKTMRPNAELIQKSRNFLLLTPLALFFVLTMGQANAHQIIKIDAPNSGTGAGQGTIAMSINLGGAITGNITDSGFGTHGFVRTPGGQFAEFDAPGANPVVGCTCPQSINDWGAVTGYYVDTTGLAHGFVRSPWGAFTSFDVPDGENGSYPIFINLEGDVVGYALDTNLLFHAFLRHPDGTFSDFVGPGSCTSGTPAGCYGSEATYVDLVGTSVGNFMDNSGNFVGHGLIRTPGGKLTTFDAPGAGTGSYQGTGCPGCNLGVNHWGAIAGSYTDKHNVLHGFLRSPEGMFTTFEAPGADTTPGSFNGTGCNSDCPVGLNDSGAITGSYWDSSNVQHGFLRTPDGTFVTVDPRGSEGTQPESINDSGAITGYYFDKKNVYHGFLWAQ